MQNPGFLPDPGFTGHYHDGVPCNDARQHWAATGESGIPDLPIIRGTWQMSYGELFTGGDMALYSESDGDVYRHIATFQRHGDELSDEDNRLSVNTAELLKRAPDMLRLVQRLAASPQADLTDLQADAAAFLQELHKEWEAN